MLGLRLLKGAALGRLEVLALRILDTFLHPTTLGCVFTGQASLSAPRPAHDAALNRPEAQRAGRSFGHLVGAGE
jgi:hypothetical protein